MDKKQEVCALVYDSVVPPMQNRKEDLSISPGQYVRRASHKMTFIRSTVVTTTQPVGIDVRRRSDQYLFFLVSFTPRIIANKNVLLVVGRSGATTVTASSCAGASCMIDVGR